MSETPKISFVSALHNCLPMTKEMLRNLEDTVDLSHSEVVLVDDASSDGTSDFLDTLAHKPNFKVIRNSENLGFAASNNKGVRAATGKIVVLLNNDLELTENWLEPMLELYRTRERVGAIGNVQRNLTTGLVDHAGIFFGLDGLPTHAHKNRRNPPRGPWKERNAITAACLLMNRALFLEIGGFDEGYRNGVEDVDLCMRLKKDGYRLYVSHESQVWHHISVAPGRNYHNEANTERFRKIWSDFARPFGQIEWPMEYLRRYARYWWRINPKLFFTALYLLITNSK